MFLSFTSATTITCAPTENRVTDHHATRKLAMPLKAAHYDHLAYATFHTDLRVINLAADLTTRIPTKLYLKTCTEKQYLDWYVKEYPLECQFRFSKAISLEDLIQVYCDKLCGDTYLSYMETCGKTAKEMADYYRRLCREQA